MSEDATELVEAQADKHTGEAKQHPRFPIQGISSTLLSTKLVGGGLVEQRQGRQRHAVDRRRSLFEPRTLALPV
jgi:hypothetical protein